MMQHWHSGDPEFRSMKGRNVTIIPPRFLEQYRAHLETERTGKCDVYWGHHSCNHETGHRPRFHRCDCGAMPLLSSVLWGTDLNEQEIAEDPVRQARLAKSETINSWSDPFDKFGNYNPTRKRRGIENDFHEQLAA